MIIRLGIYESKVRKVISNNSGWKIVCEQEKVPFIITEQPDCPVMIFDGDTPDWFAQFMKDGGIGIITDCYPGLLPFDIEYVGDASIESVDLAELGSSLTRVQCVARLYSGTGFGIIRIHENRVIKSGISQDEFPVFLYSNYGKGGCFYTGLPMARLVTALGDTLRPTTCFSNYSERIVSIDKHHLIKAMREILVMAFHQRDLSYFYLGYYPKGYQSSLAFRIDVDGVFGENLINVSKGAIDNGFILTFFVNKSLCEDDKDFISKIDHSHEIGNHADVHNLFTDYEANFRNIVQGRDWLNLLGFTDNPWFSSPRGMWNYSLHEALDQLGYLYTSDFGAAVAGFPFFPYIKGEKSTTMQIPVNPFSVERAAIWRNEAEKQEITPEYIAEFYIKIIEDNYRQGYPSILYSHPEKFGLMADYVFNQINQKIVDMNIWKTTLTDFAIWWLRRDQTNYSVEFDKVSKSTVVKGIIDRDLCVKEI